jgi:predicted anti-sigma-YlaC factor YlaD
VGQLSSTDCDLIRASVSAALDDELSEVGRVRLDAHLRSCADCRAYAASAAESTRMLREAPLETLGFSIVLPSRRGAIARRLQVTAAAAALVAVFGLSAAVGTFGSGGGQRATVTGSQAGALRSTEQELKLLRASSARDRLSTHAQLAL